MSKPPQPPPHRTSFGTTRDMSVPLRAVLTGLGIQRSLAEGTTLFCQGDAADALYVLDQGRLEVSVLSEAGRRLTLNVMQPGTVFGEIGLFDDGLRSATVTASTASSVLRIDRQRLIGEIHKNPAFSLDMIRLCVERLRWVNAQLEDHVFQPLDVRLARRLLYLLAAQAHGDVLSLSQSALADHVGVTREAVAKLLAEWKAAGIVAPGRGRITILDVEALRKRALTGQI